MTYSESRHGGEISEGEDPDYRYANHDPEYIDFSPENVFSKEENVPHWLKEEFTVDEDVSPGDTIHVVIVRYSDGGTFGYTSGYWQIFGATTDARKAVSLANAIPNGDWKDSPILGEYAYDVWSGYFSSFEGVDVHTFLVR